MFRLWAKKWKNNRLVEDIVIHNDKKDTRTHKVLQALEDACVQFNLGIPIWLDITISDFKHFNKARFFQDNFIEEIDFDYLEISIIEED